MSGLYDNLALVVTYDCVLRCEYCPVIKNKRSMSFETAKKGIDLFLSENLKRIRIAGADPLKNIELVKKILEYVDSEITVRLTSNGVGLDDDFILYLEQFPNLELVLSVDGDKDTQLKMRKSAKGEADSFSWFEKYAGCLSNHKRLAHVNMVISPENVGKTVANVAYLARKGFFRLNILPAYYVKWNEQQVLKLKKQFELLAVFLKKGLKRKLPFYIVNLDNVTPVSLFRQEIVIDTDGHIYNNDVICSRMLAKDKEIYSLGNVYDISNFNEMKSGSSIEWQKILNNSLGDDIAESTALVDRELTRFVNSIETLFL